MAVGAIAKATKSERGRGETKLCMGHPGEHAFSYFW